MKSFIHKLLAALAILTASFGAFATAQADDRRVETRSISAPAEVSLEEAQRLFRRMAAQRDIAFGYVKDGCYARAHLMVERIREMGYSPVRVWSFANGEDLYVRTGREASGFVTWWYHVAPAVSVRHNGETTFMVIDPSMFSGPVTLEEWVGAQRRTATSPRPLVQVTRLGEAPMNPRTRLRNGTGYWPDFDPPGGADHHATSTMARYKPLERS